MNEIGCGIQRLITGGNGMRRANLVTVVLLFMLIPLLPLQEVSANQSVVNPGPVEHTLFFIGEADDTKSGSMTPSESSLNNLIENEVNSEASAERLKLLSFESSIASDGIIPEGTWIYRTNYRVEGASSAAANWTVEIEIAGETFSNSIFSVAGRGPSFDIDVEIDELVVNQGEQIIVTFYLENGIMWTSPDDNSKMFVSWGGPESTAGLVVNAPLVEIEMMEPNVDGNEVFFPIRFHSSFANELAKSDSMIAKIRGDTIQGDPYISTISDGVEVVYVWNAEGFQSGEYTLNLTLQPQEGVNIQTEIIHNLVLDGSSGDGDGWYPTNEPVRTGGTNLHLEIDVNQVDDRLERTSTLEIEGAVATWIRWGLDNIGNESLDSTSWWRELSESGGIVGADGLNNRLVDDSELDVLQNHLTGSSRDLADFLDRGLALESKAILGGEPFDLEGALDIDIDLNGQNTLGPDLITINIRSSTVLDSGSFIFVESFVRSQSQTYWTKVSLDATLSTNPLQGISNVFSEEIDSNHLRIGIAENVRVSFSSEERIDDFRVTITPATSFIDGPMVGLFLLLAILIVSTTVSVRGTRNKARSPSIFWLILSVSILLVLYTMGIRMTIVLGAGIGTFVLSLIIIFISPSHRIDGIDDIPNKKIPVIDCPICNQANPITSEERPLRLPCGGCGRTLLIE
tara:strand:+ start:3703 stop:5757 length:2055 start_codon:yes stop_codon:yes gene_type:complete